jgi:hypothetical protein
LQKVAIMRIGGITRKDGLPPIVTLDHMMWDTGKDKSGKPSILEDVADRRGLAKLVHCQGNFHIIFEGALRLVTPGQQPSECTLPKC